MRKAQKRETLECISSLHQAHEEIRAALRQKEYETARNMLCECQEFATVLGESIEKAEGEGHSTIAHMERYCETLFQVFKEIEIGAGGSSEHKWYKSLRKQLLAVENSVKNDISVKKEVVFLPYKVSMWDSLESVWMSADQDGECDSYVIPVPYFDRNADGSLGEMHYEGGDFPEYVPVTDWQEYDIAARHPDMIFIHNPYDGTNRVTTVHPSFYAKELKNYTDMLVYIPYFVCMDSDVPAHFCVMPGTIHADRVVVQSEKARQIYIKEFRKFEREYNCRGKFGDPEKKFLALGSPKFDKVLSTTRENVEIPEEWKRKIVREDGSERKVLLYNTSVSKLLEGKEKTLEKIRSVLALMKELEEIVLLWRPHPLSGSTYAAERPQLLEEYEGLVEAYKMEDWGIFDDSPDVDRAIAISDAYYGDKSSLVELCRVTGKPVMIQDVEIASD